MIYDILRPTVRFATKLYFGKIFVSGVENLPKDKPIILASNHPTAFIEPCMLACYLPVRLHFLVRGDLFSKSWLSWLLKGTNQIPIFRQKDGVGNVKKNLITQNLILELFQENNALLMFPEAHTHENLFLRPLKKGISRFAFMHPHSNVQVVPIGVNFDRHVKFGSKVSIVIGKPIDIDSLEDQAWETEAKKHKHFLDLLSQRMQKCLRHINHEEVEENLHKAYRIIDGQKRFSLLPVVEKRKDIFEEEQNFANLIDQSDESTRLLNATINELSHQRLKKPSILDLLGMFIFIPIFLISLLFHFIPTQISRYIVKKKITMHEFVMPVFLAIMIFEYLFLIPVTFIVTIIIGGIAWYVFLAFVISGLFGVFYLKAFQDKWQYLFLSSHQKKELQYTVSNFNTNFPTI